ncbi:uncharacterized protein [Haliotis asinina]|uniref:uncharacterized protein n=1 Tax=Haliotis asinina TaxID=109174 RepID=UPI003531EA41
MAGISTLWLLFLLLRMTWSNERPSRSNGTGHHNKGRGTDRWIVMCGNDRLLMDGKHEDSWKVLIVVDDNASIPACSRKQSCFTVSLGDPAAQSYDVIKVINDHRLRQRALGFLTVISRGADVIYDRCAVYNQEDNVQGYFLNHPTHGIVYVDRKGYLNRHKLFQSTNTNYANQRLLRYCAQDNLSPLIQQKVGPILPGNLNPQTSAHLQSLKQVYNRLPTVFLPNHVYTELEDVPTLYHKEGFWSMLMLFLPSGFWVGQALSQRLLWEVGGVVGLIPKWDSYQQFLNRTTNTSRVLKSLLKDVVDPWDCKIGSTVFQCIRELSRHLLDHTVMTSEDRGLIQAWLTDLELAGYKEPKKANHEFHCHGTLIANSGLIRPLLISASQPPTSDLSTVISTLCPQLKYSTLPAPVITDVALIITFNSDKFYGNLPLLEAIHRRYFAHIIYCGPRQDRFKAKLTASIASSNILFIEGLKEGWHFMWECLTLTSKFNLNVRGYLQIGDDTLLNSWNIADLPRDRIWIVHHGQLIRRDEERNGWVWWKRASGQKAVNRALDTVVRTNSKEPGNIHVSNFLKTYTANVGDIGHVYHASSDLVYIPSKMADQFTYLADIFRRERVIVELTYPTLIHGLAPSAGIYVIQGKILWGYKRRQYAEIYHEYLYSLHPYKLSHELKSTEGRAFLCGVYMPLQQEHLALLRDQSNYRK